MIAPLLCCLLLGQEPQPAPAPAQPAASAPAPMPMPEPKPVTAPVPPKTPVTKVEDKGLLEHAYFGAVIPFEARHGVDAIWIKEGLSLKGKRIACGAWKAQVLKPGREEKHLQRAADLARMIPDALLPELRTAFKGAAEWELGGAGDYRLEGRVVDANVPNTASKLMLGWLAGKDNLENVTWDMRLVDAATGETVLAFHHRMVKVNTLGSLDASLRDWAAAFPKQLLERLR